MTTQRHTSRRAAFSLVELVLVLAIIATMAAIAAPRYGTSIDRYRADIAARRIAADLQLVQTRARTMSRSQTITFDATRSSYTLDNEAGAEQSNRTYTVNLSEPPYNATIAALGLGTNVKTITFNGYGVPDRSGSITIRTNSTQRIVTVAADSGAVTIP